MRLSERDRQRQTVKHTLFQLQVKNFEGESACHLAAKNGRVDVCILFANKYGMSVEEEDGIGRNCREILEQNGFEEEAAKLDNWMKTKG